MADRVIRIVLDTKQANSALDQLEGNLKDVDKESKSASKSANALGGAFRTLVAGLSIRELVQRADAFTTIGNRLRLVTDSTAEFNAVQDELIGIAQRTRSDLGATADLYARVARSTDELGRSQAETLRFTESVNQAIQISGATSQEAAAGVIQFSQGLASGALRGDELRSVLEQMPRLARALADGFGVSIGELRKLGEAGELAGEKIFDIILEAGPELNAEFEKVTPTMAQAITTVSNFATVVIGEFNEAAGITEGLVDIFKLTDEETQELGASVRSLALDFREFVEVATVAVANFVETVGPKFGAIQAEIIKIIAALTRDEDLFRAALEGQAEFEAELGVIQSKLDAEFEAIRRNNEERRKAAEDRDADLNAPGTRVDRGGAVDPEDAKELERVRKAQEALLASLRQQTEALQIANTTGRDYRDVLQELKIEALAAAGADETFGEAALFAAGALQKQKEEAQALADEADRMQDDLDAAAELTLEARDAAEVYADELAEIQRLLGLGLITEDVADKSIANLDKVNDDLEDFFRRARENSQDILAGFLESGLQDLDEFGRAFAQMLLQLASQALAAGIFEAILGAQGGGGGGNSTGGYLQAALSIFGGGRQFGGGVQAGQAVTTGEGGRFGAEVFVPNVGGNVVPINSGRGDLSGMEPPTVNNTIVNTIDPGEITGAFQSGAGDNVLLNRISTRKNAFRKALGV